MLQFQSVSLGWPLASRWEKVNRIFHRFNFNRDGGLNRDEMAALLVAVYPRIIFSDDQMRANLCHIFEVYGDFVDRDKGLTCEGLLRKYDDGAGDLDRDFYALALALTLENPTAAAAAAFTSSSIADDGVTNTAVFPKYGIVFDATWDFVDIVGVFIQKLNLRQAKDGKVKYRDRFSDPGWSRELGQLINISDESVLPEELELGQNYAHLLEGLVVFRRRADKASSKEEVFDRHMAIGRVLYDYNLCEEALVSFNRALELEPNNVRAHFYAGNCLYELGSHGEAKEVFLNALVAAKSSGWWKMDYLLRHIHVNLGIVLENEGMVFTACDHYREAVNLCPTHFRALKRLGSALHVVGEYRAAVKALEEAISVKRNYVDAYYDMGLALIAMGEEEKAILEFQKVLDLKPGDVDAFYNLGGIYLDMGWYLRAFEMYAKVLVVWPNHWKAQLGMVVTLLGAGKSEEAKKALKEALKMANRVELHERIAYLKQLQKRRLEGKGSDVGEGAYITVEPSKFKTVEETTALRRELTNALDIVAFQKITRLNQCDVELINKQVNDNAISVAHPAGAFAERSISKASLEGILRELLGFLKPEAFAEAVKAINRKILPVLDESKSGRVDLGLFLAVVAPLCRGLPDRRKLIAYRALLLQPGNEGSTRIRKTDVHRYLNLLRAIYISSHGISEILEINGRNMSRVCFTDFLALFDDPDRGFGILGLFSTAYTFA